MSVTSRPEACGDDGAHARRAFACPAGTWLALDSPVSVASESGHGRGSESSQYRAGAWGHRAAVGEGASRGTCGVRGARGACRSGVWRPRGGVATDAGYGEPTGQRRRLGSRARAHRGDPEEVRYPSGGAARSLSWATGCPPATCDRSSGGDRLRAYDGRAPSRSTARGREARRAAECDGAATAARERRGGRSRTTRRTSRCSSRCAERATRRRRSQTAWCCIAAALDGSDIVHRVHAEGTEDYVVFDSRPAHEEIAYDVDVSRVAGLRLVSNVLEFLDEGGAPRLRVAPPYVVDGAGKSPRGADRRGRVQRTTRTRARHGGIRSRRLARRRALFESAGGTSRIRRSSIRAWVATGSMSVTRGVPHRDVSELRAMYSMAGADGTVRFRARSSSTERRALPRRVP